MTPVYLEDFSNRESIAEAFCTTLPDDIDILFAWYGEEDYFGEAVVLYQYDGKLYEVNASHCSCFGLEEQWLPEETTVEAVRMRGFGYLSEEGRAQLMTLLDEYEALYAAKV